MARLARVVLPGVPHHIVQRGVRSMRIFETDQDRRFYLEMVREHSDKHDLMIISWCLMTNHVHLIGVPGTEKSLAGAMGFSHRAYSSSFNARHGKKGYLFQGRFFSTPMDQLHFYEAVRYVLRNPVRAGMVSDAFSYPWSSAIFNAGLRDTDPLAQPTDRLDWIRHWEDYLGAETRDIEILRSCTRTGRPCGNDAFIERAERLTGRKLQKEKPGKRPHRIVSP